MSVSKKLYKGAFWNAISGFGSRGVNFIIFIVLARLLGPDSFGLLGMAVVLIDFLGCFSEFGLISALIQAEKVSEEDYNTVFWGTVLFSGIIYILTFILAPVIASFYGEPKLVAITRVVFIMYLVAPLAYVPEAIERRNLRYDRLAAAYLVSLIISGAIGISLALLKFGVWSLVVQQIAMALIRGVALLWLTKWAPKAVFSYAKLKRLVKVGSGFTSINIIYYFTHNLDSIMVGKILGPAALGIYNMAMRIAKYPLTKVWAIFGEMLFPAFASFRNDMERVRKNFIKVTMFGGIVLIPVIISAFFGIKPLIAIVFGERWIATVPVIRIVLLYVIFDSLFLSDESILMVFDKLKFINIVKVASMVVFFPIGYAATKMFGLNGMAAVFSAVAVLNLVVIKKYLLELIDIKLSVYLRKINIVFIITPVLFVVMLCYALLAYNALPGLVFLAGEGVIVAAFIIYMLKKYKLIDIKNKKINFDNLLAN